MAPLKDPDSRCDGFRYIQIEGKVDSIVLDGMYMKNVIVRNADIIYDGGPVRLENVYFINCNLHFRESPTTRDLGGRMLAANAITFKTVA